jgi:P27 family predicted phage terminase small subunit
MPGRKRRPTVLRMLEGNPSRRPFNDREPHPAALEEACPAELTDSVAQAEWTRGIVPAIRIGQVTAADRVMAIAHCQLWAVWQSQVAEAEQDGHVIPMGEKGYLVANVARTAANKTFQLLVKVDAELGFTPTSRSKVTTAKDSGQAPDKWAGLLPSAR